MTIVVRSFIKVASAVWTCRSLSVSSALGVGSAFTFTLSFETAAASLVEAQFSSDHSALRNVTVGGPSARSSSMLSRGIGASEIICA